MLRSQELTRVRRGAYAEPAADLDPRVHLQLLEATVPQCSSAAVVSHMSAAVLHGLPVEDDALDRVHLTRFREGGGKVPAPRGATHLSATRGEHRRGGRLPGHQPRSYGAGSRMLAEPGGVGPHRGCRARQGALVRGLDGTARTLRRPHRGGLCAPGDRAARRPQRECGRIAEPPPLPSRSAARTPSGTLAGRSSGGSGETCRSLRRCSNGCTGPSREVAGGPE